MVRTVNKIDDLVQIRNVIVYVNDFQGLEKLMKGLLKNCPGVNIYSTANNYVAVNELVLTEPNPKQERTMGHHFSLDQLVMEQDINRTIVEPYQSKLFLGLLGKTYCIQHQKIIKETKTIPIDLVIINFASINIPEGPNDFENASTRIDIAGQAILSAVVANSPRVMTVCHPCDYFDLIAELKARKGYISFKSRLEAAKRSALYLQEYSTKVSSFFNDLDIEEVKKCYEINNPVVKKKVLPK